MGRIAAILLGCLASGLAAGLGGAAVLMVQVDLREGSFGDDWLSGMMVFGSILSVIGLAASLTLGLAGHVLLTRLGRTGWAAYAALGALTGGLAGVLLGGLADRSLLVTAVAAGAFGALAFRAVVRPRAAPRLAPAA